MRATTTTFALALVAALVPLASTASAAPGGQYGADAATVALMHRQTPLIKAANVLRTAIDAGKDPGFAGLEIVGDRLVLTWKGPLPAHLAALRTKVGLPVEVRAAATSRADLSTAAHQITTVLKTDPAITTIHITGHDGGLIVETDAAVTVRPANVASAVPVIYRQSPATLIKHTGGWRDYDTVPFSGGARMYNPYPRLPRGHIAYCSTGFGVVRNGQTFMLTAAHCATAPDQVNTGYPDWFNTRMGQAADENWPHDVILIDTFTPGHNSGKIYDGPGVGINNRNQQFEKSVSSAAYTVPGMYVCQSGMTSGAICNIKVSNDFTFAFCSNNTDSDGDYDCLEDLIVANQINGYVASRGGDSGGPVFALDGPKVIAIGTVTGGNSSNSSIMYFQDIATAYSDFGLTAISTS